MGAFEDVVMKAKNAADIAGKKTGELVEITRLRLNVSELEERIRSQYQELGKTVYNAAKDHTDCTDYVHEKSEAIDRLFAELTKLNEKISELKNEKKCASCGAVNPQEAVYCQKCGTKL